ncbi:MAG: hypothetical protein AAF573_22990, partial [Bacteroidota bacterium]
SREKYHVALFNHLIIFKNNKLPNYDYFKIGKITVMERSSFADNIIAIGSENGCSIFNAKAHKNTFFISDIVPFDLKFIGKQLVIINNYEVYVFDASSEIPKLQWKQSVRIRLINILRVSRRNQFALLDSNGKITIWDTKR